MRTVKQASLDLALGQREVPRVRGPRSAKALQSRRLPLLIDYQSWIAWTSAVLDAPDASKTHLRE
jgi:hypothetical protein